MPSPIVGPSYNLDSRPASVQRTINMMPVPLEPGNERTDWVLRDVPGLRPFADLSQPFDPFWSSVRLLANFETDARDETIYNATPTLVAATVGSGNAQIRDNNAPPALTASYIEWSGSQFGRTASEIFTLEVYVKFLVMSDSRRHILAWGLSSGPTDGVSVHYFDVGGQIGFRNGLIDGGGTVIGDIVNPDPANFVHVAIVVPAGNNPNVRMYLNGTQVLNGICASMGTVSSGNIRIGPNTTQNSGFYPNRWFDIAAVRVTAAERYTSAFTPPPLPWPNQ